MTVSFFGRQTGSILEGQIGWRLFVWSTVHGMTRKDNLSVTLGGGMFNIFGGRGAGGVTTPFSLFFGGGIGWFSVGGFSYVWWHLTERLLVL